MALGAQRHEVLQMILRESLLLVLIGVAIGLATAAAAGRLIASLLFGLAPTDVTTMLLATLVMIFVSALAAFMPARSASRVDPLAALRYE
jgi:ABC-type antimicrobial peptide transport system permease subunit